MSGCGKFRFLREKADFEKETRVLREGSPGYRRTTCDVPILALSVQNSGSGAGCTGCYDAPLNTDPEFLARLSV